MKLREIKKRLLDCAELFRHESETARHKGRTLYKVAVDAITLAGELEKELKAFKNPPLPPEGRALPEAPSYKPPYDVKWEAEDKVSRITYFLKHGPESEEFRRYLKYSGLSLEEAKKLLHESPPSS
jgi:hypothetical protein